MNITLYKKIISIAIFFVLTVGFFGIHSTTLIYAESETSAFTIADIEEDIAKLKVDSFHRSFEYASDRDRDGVYNSESPLVFVDGFNNVDGNINRVLIDNLADEDSYVEYRPGYWVTETEDAYFDEERKIGHFTTEKTTGYVVEGYWVNEDGSKVGQEINDFLIKRRVSQVEDASGSLVEKAKEYGLPGFTDTQEEVLSPSDIYGDGGFGKEAQKQSVELVQEEIENQEQAEFVPLEPEFFEKLGGQETIDKNDTSIFFNNIFRFGIYIASFLATIMIAAGGIQYMSTDAVTGKTEGREKVTYAVMGLLLILFSWILLSQINPDLLNLSLSNDNVSSPSSGVSKNNTTNSNSSEGTSVDGNRQGQYAQPASSVGMQNESSEQVNERETINGIPAVGFPTATADKIKELERLIDSESANLSDEEKESARKKILELKNQ